MKKCWIIAGMALLLAGCGTQETFETISDTYDIPAMAAVREVIVELPQDAAALTIESEEAGTIYLCDDYTVTVQTLPGGDLDGTLRTVTGYGRDALTVIETAQGEFTRYDLVWSSAGEGGDQVARAAVLDDGSYHYVLTVMADAAQTEALAQNWEAIFQSFGLASY